MPWSGTAIAAQRPEVISWMVASMSSGAWLRPYTIKRSLMRPMMNSSPPETKPESPVRSQGASGVPAEGVTILAPNVRLLSSGLCQ
ncbi:Uncharacterised protein [Mycobacterium tuberculosis]|uniref:Uncharacterized protein n=1 Tax=Mycobacterium tuberculosis TaxID=1773 RepID=A0A655FZA2_MYCTX|nr:Uncharacterised protein [Mycobacterium tuberculosis]